MEPEECSTCHKQEAKGQAFRSLPLHTGQKPRWEVRLACLWVTNNPFAKHLLPVQGPPGLESVRVPASVGGRGPGAGLWFSAQSQPPADVHERGPRRPSGSREEVAEGTVLPTGIQVPHVGDKDVLSAAGDRVTEEGARGTVMDAEELVGYCTHELNLG